MSITRSTDASHLSKNATRVFILLLSLITVVLLLTSCRAHSSAENEDGATAEPDGGEKVYTFEDAGFSAEFPEKPVERQSDIVDFGDTTFIGGTEIEMTAVSFADAPSNLVDFINAGPTEEQKKTSLDATLTMAAMNYCLIFNIENVDQNNFEYFDYDKVSTYSGLVVFSGYEDLSEYGGSPEQQLYFCCGVVYSEGRLYEFINARNFKEAAISAAESFQLLPRSAVETSSESKVETNSNKPQNAIDWSDAQQHIGETVTIYGPVMGTDYVTTANGGPTYIDIGANYPDSSRVTIVIWGEDRHAFSSDPESYYAGKTVAVTGEVYFYDRACYIKVTSPSKIQILES